MAKSENIETMLFSDMELLHGMANSDANAFRLIYRRYWEDLFITAVKAL